MDYENIAFHCRLCHQIGHLQNSCSPLQFHQKGNICNYRAKILKPCDLPPMESEVSFDSDKDDEGSNDEMHLMEKVQ